MNAQQMLITVRYARQIAGMLLGLWLTACASMSNRMDLLEQSQRAYESALRWGHFDLAYAMHREADQHAAPAPATLANYRVTSYQVLSRSVAQDNASAEQTIELRYYNTDYLQERTLTAKQHWVYDAVQNRWLIASPIPVFK